MFPKELEFFKCRINAFYERVKQELCFEKTAFHAEYAVTPHPVPFAERLNLAYKPVRIGEKWGENWQSAWFQLSVAVPEAFAGKELALLFNSGGEALIFDESGTPVYGLTGNSFFSPNYLKTRYPLKGTFTAGAKLEFWIEAAANELTGMLFDKDKTLLKEHPQGRFVGTLLDCSLAVFDRELWHLKLDLEVLLSMTEGLPAGDFRISRYISIISNAADVYNENPENAAEARAVLKRIFDITPSGAMMTMHSTGHAHIDTGWLWPVRESIRKCARTFSSQLALLEEYPDYVFGASAAQHYAFVKEHYPALYEKIKQAVAGGRWEIQGGMWVEADCNLISGESMVRQFLYGKNFFKDEFGADVKNVWIPDVFGYSAALPQIAKLCGCDYFLTQKLSWNQFNQFPHQTFVWQGIDGSELLTHFPPENTYNSLLEPKAAMATQNNYKSADILSDFMCLYGIGDGGGGPFPEQLEYAKRMASLDGCPRVKFNRADHFFEKIEAHRAELPVWKGELYFEMHRGTFTSQSRTKRGNRKCEQMLALTEFVCSMLSLEKYPQNELSRLWKLLLLNQFHDIIPGSSIDQVYSRTEREYQEILTSCEKLLGEAKTQLFSCEADSAMIVNSLSYDCKTIVELPWVNSSVTDANGNMLEVQHETGRTVVQLELPKSSVVQIRKGAPAELPAETQSSELVLENELVRYVFSPNAEIIEAVDKEINESILKPGGYGNVFALYVDNPVNFDAWDVDVYYQHQTPVHPVSFRAEKTVSGKLRSMLEFELRISEQSTVYQTVILESGTKRLDFKTKADWHETHKMLRTSFPVNIFSNEASFDIQYGFVKRSMTENSSVEMAQFEVCGQRYADVSCYTHGVALLNDCKYGYKVKESVIDLALLRSPTYPDSTADQGEHFFTYSLLPHKGNLIDSDVMAQAALLNRPPLFLENAGKGAEPVCSLESDSLSLEVVKKAEKEDCRIIRIVETKGLHGKGVLKLRNPEMQLIETGLTEWNELGASSAEIAMKPFEIKTFKLKEVYR